MSLIIVAAFVGLSVISTSDAVAFAGPLGTLFFAPHVAHTPTLPTRGSLPHAHRLQNLISPQENAETSASEAFSNKVQDWTNVWSPTAFNDGNTSYIAVGEVIHLEPKDYGSIFLIKSAFDDLRGTVDGFTENAFQLQMILGSSTPPLNIKMQGGYNASG